MSEPVDYHSPALNEQVEVALARRRLDFYTPYPKQREFHAASKDPTKTEIMLLAGNQLGKTLSAAAQTAIFATGQYPDWWEGRRWDRPTSGWVAGPTGQSTRDAPQKLLLGESNEWGTGMIPGRNIIEIKKSAHGVPDAVETVTVKHDATGKTSRILFKTYDQGRLRWQGATIDYCIAEGQRVWMDDGRQIPIEQVRPGDLVRSMNSKGVATSQRVVAVHDRGTQEVVDVHLSRGPWLRMTPDHKVYQGMRAAVPVKEASRIAQYPGPWEPTHPKDRADAWYRWAGLVIAEGYHAGRKITMSDGPAVREAIAPLPSTARVREKIFDERHHHVPDWVLYWDEFWKEIPAGLAHEKEIPQWIFQSSNRAIRLFLGSLYAGDGWATRQLIGYASTSRVLAEQLSSLLARLGIRSSVNRRISKTATWKDQWWVLLCNFDSVIRFTDTIRVPGKEGAFAACRVEADRRRTSRSESSPHFQGPTPETEEGFAKQNEYKRRNRVAKNRYAQIRELIPAGKARVYDLSVEGTHRFIVGNSLVSNCWFDEEPPEDIYSEGCTRCQVLGGFVFLTFTPLLGMSEVVSRFLQQRPPNSVIIKMGINDALHYTPEQRIAILARYPEHERDARAYGNPIMGSGKVFPLPWEFIAETPIQLPAYWRRLCAVDFGWDHPTAAVWLAYDPDTDTIHITDTYAVREQTPILHAAAIKARGVWIPVAWPFDGLAHEPGSGKTLADLYRQQGVNMLPTHATHPPLPGKKEGTSGYSTEAGILDMIDRMQTGRLKVFSTLSNFKDEYDVYHRKDGLIVKKGDDIMSAARVGCMAIRHAQTRIAPRSEQLLPAWLPSDPGMGALG